MELSKLTICRQDVIVVSDSEADSNTVDSKKKKKHKRKPQCVRNVKLTTVTVNRIVPYCNRHRCRSAEHYHRQTSMNTKYRKRKSATIETKHKKNQAEGILCETDKNDDEISMELSGNLYSPITVTSSSEMYENVSSCSFNVLSSDSDELEDLINLTRKRMKNSNGTFDHYPLRKNTTTSQDDYQNISSNDDVLNDSINSMDTVVLYHGNAQRSPERLNQVNLKTHNNNNIEPMLLCKSPNLNNNKVPNQKIPSLSNQENNNDLSPLYEISGKVFMEHYLNTSFI